MAGDSQNMERSTLERKDRAELAAVAAALGLKVPSRAKKADIVTLILDVVAQPGDSASSAPEAPSSDRATDSPADIAAEATGAAVVEATTDAPIAGQQQLPTVEADHEAADDADESASQSHDEANAGRAGTCRRRRVGRRVVAVRRR
jgi:transcription termination factor Rho